MVPHEYNEIMIGKGFRQNRHITAAGDIELENRANNSHRKIFISRGVLQTSSSAESKAKRNTIFNGSNCVSLGMTKIVANGRLAPTENTVLSDSPIGNNVKCH